MNVHVSSFSKVPIYEQIRVQIKQNVLNNTIIQGEQLPSIRVMAKELQIGIVTVKRAYEELEAEGIVINIPGKGCYVKYIDEEKIKEINIIEASKMVDEIIGYANTCNISKNDIIKLVNDKWR
ncbi:MAG: GntR family transcriptional regulator [Erysipelotrichaceae bacterium]